MYCWRVSKYSPKFKDENGYYLNEGWTSICDIGKSFDGVEFTLASYNLYEAAYIQAVILFANLNNITFFAVEGLEKGCIIEYSDMDTEIICCHFKELQNGIKIPVSSINIIARLILREMMWCKLESKDMFVHFGYDYYMYIGSRRNDDVTLNRINNLGLFVEEIVSPYL